MTDAGKFIESLCAARDLLESYPALNYARLDELPKQDLPRQLSLATFLNWPEYCEQELKREAPVRIIHHLSCTGGTLIAKCIASLPNVAILSEVNPLSELPGKSSSPRFAPSDLTYLASASNFPDMEALSKEIFKSGIGVIKQHAKMSGKYLVLREHSHSDYLVGAKCREAGTLRSLLQDDHQILAIVTVRHPLDCYLSMLNNGWVKFEPPTFDEYCRRYLKFIEHNDRIPVYRYEDFIEDPYAEMQRIAQALDLPFNDDFEDVFDLIKLSGSSGRSSNVIGRRKRREVDESLRDEAVESANYATLCDRLNYPTSIES
jgi:hypothetical protein